MARMTYEEAAEVYEVAMSEVERLEAEWPRTPVSEWLSYDARGECHPNDIRLESARQAIVDRHMASTGWTDEELIETCYQ